MYSEWCGTMPADGALRYSTFMPVALMTRP
jgi:hypothetical protein